MKQIYEILTELALALHTFAYKAASRYAIKLEGGLHPKHRIIKYREFFMENISPQEEVLDIGCGNGALARAVAEKAKRVTAIDIEENKIEEAKKKHGRENVEYLVGDATRKIPGAKFDVVILSNVLEHIKERTEFLNKIKGLAPKILIRVPMIDRDWITVYKKELGMEWRLDYTHYTEYTMDSFRREMEMAGLQIKNFSVQFGEIWAVVGKE